MKTGRAPPGRPLLLAAIVCIAAAAMLPGYRGLENDFLHYDDPDVIVDNPRLQNPGLRSAAALFTEVRDHAYLPFYYLALMPDAAAGGGSPRAYHLGSLVWHALNGILLFLLLRMLAGDFFAAFAAALLFAVHPVAVESVAWASGRKDQASLLGLLAGLILWSRWTELRGARRITLAVLSFTAACFAKGSVVVFPLLALLATARLSALGRAAPGRQAPAFALLFLLALLIAAVHVSVAESQGTLGAGALHTPAEGALLLLEALPRYFSHLFFPVSLSIHYGMEPGGAFGLVHLAGLLILLAGVLALPGLRSPRFSAPAVALLWILASLLPFNNVFPRTSIPMADRYLIAGLPAFAWLLAIPIRLLPPAPRAGALFAVVLALGWMASLRTADFRDGETVFRAAMRVEPASPFPPLAVAEALLLQDLREPVRGEARLEAAALLSKSLDLAQRRGEPLLILRSQVRLGDLLLRMGRFEEAAEHFAVGAELLKEDADRLRLLGLDPFAIEHNLAISLLGAGRTEDARLALQGILDRSPGHGPARLTVAQLDIREFAASLPRSGAPPDPQAAEAQRRIDASLAGLEALLSEIEGSGGSDELFQGVASELAAAYLRLPGVRGGILKALPLAERLIRRLPGHPSGYALRAEIRERVGEDPALALADYLRAANAAPDEARHLVSAARLLVEGGENRRALQLLQRARQIEPSNRDVARESGRFLHRMAEHHRRLGEPERALQAARLAAEADPGSAAVHHLLGELLLGRGDVPDWEGARAAFEKALSAEPEHGGASLGLARYHQARGIRALSELERRTRDLGGDERAAARQRILDAAMDDFRRALDLAAGSPELVIARNYVRDHAPPQREASKQLLEEGYAAKMRGDSVAALEILRRAVRTDGSHVDARWMLAEALYEAEATGEAIVHLRAALSLDPEHLPSLALSVRVFYVAGLEPEALRSGRRFLAASEPLLPDSVLEAERENVGRILALIER